MKYAPALLPNLTISEKASQIIRDWVASMSYEKNRQFVPAVFIVRNINQGLASNPKPAVGLYGIDEIEESDIFIQNNLRFVFPVTGDDYDLFDGKILEYENGEYFIL